MLDESQGFLARAGADGQHADHRAHAEDDAERGEKSAGLLRAQVVGGQREIRKIAQDDERFFGSCSADGSFSEAVVIWEWPVTRRRRPAFLLCWSGFAMATCAPGFRPVRTTWLSLRRTTLTSAGTKPAPD